MRQNAAGPQQLQGWVKAALAAGRTLEELAV